MLLGEGEGAGYLGYSWLFEAFSIGFGEEDWCWEWRLVESGLATSKVVSCLLEHSLVIVG